MKILISSILFSIFVSCTHSSAVDDQWMKYLESPPDAASARYAELSSRADELVSNASLVWNGGDVDVVISGGANFDAYYLGVAQVFARMKNMTQVRFAGASAGGMAPFEVTLKGEKDTIIEHLSYGILQEEFPKEFWNDLSDASLQDHHWRLMASWMVEKYNATLNRLDGKVFLALSCLDPLPKLVKVSEFISTDQTERAFMGTGTFVEWYDGMLCSDGGSMSGKKMTPLFQDHLRDQIIVDLMETGAASSEAFHYTLDSYSDLIRKGQDEAISFVRTGTCRANAITLCEKDRDVSSNVCK